MTDSAIKPYVGLSRTNIEKAVNDIRTRALAGKGSTLYVTVSHPLLGDHYIDSRIEFSFKNHKFEPLDYFGAPHFTDERHYIKVRDYSSQSNEARYETFTTEKTDKCTPRQAYAMFDEGIPMACPRTGGYIGWKVALKYGFGDFHEGSFKSAFTSELRFVMLYIPASAKRSSAFGAKCRASKAMVLGIYDINGESYDIAESLIYSNFVYETWDFVTAQAFTKERFIECGEGIHHFTSLRQAMLYSDILLKRGQDEEGNLNVFNPFTTETRIYATVDKTMLDRYGIVGAGEARYDRSNGQWIKGDAMMELVKRLEEENQ